MKKRNKKDNQKKTSTNLPLQTTLQAKLLLSGTYSRSTFSEFTDVRTIRSHILHYLPTHTTRINAPNFGLGVLAQLTTTRDVYIADGKFTLVLDRTDFGHAVGEVELELEAEGGEAGAGGWAGEGEEFLKGGGKGGEFSKEGGKGKGEGDEERAEKAHGEIDAFLAKYSWFCRPGPVEGKLSAYFRMQKEKQMEGGRAS